MRVKQVSRSVLQMQVESFCCIGAFLKARTLLIRPFGVLTVASQRSARKVLYTKLLL